MAKTNAERKRAQRERKQRLGMRRMEMDLARGFEDQTEYLVRLVLDDAARIERDRSRNEENEKIEEPRL